MKDLAVDVDEIRGWFVADDDGAHPFLVVRVPSSVADSWETTLVDAARRCYAADEFLETRAVAVSAAPEEILAALLPDRGSVMAGDFGEILSYLFLGAAAQAEVVVGPKKWRLKQDRLKAAPYSDVVQFVLESWPTSSARDRLICAEVKTKSTDGGSTPIASAIADSEKDRVRRLAQTLAWLRERALTTDLGTTSLEILDRYIKANEHPPAEKEFYAVAVICDSLVEAELIAGPTTALDGCRLVVIAVPELQQKYQQLFDAVLASSKSQSGG